MAKLKSYKVRVLYDGGFSTVKNVPAKSYPAAVEILKQHNKHLKVLNFQKL